MRTVRPIPPAIAEAISALVRVSRHTQRRVSAWRRLEIQNCEIVETLVRLARVNRDAAMSQAKSLRNMYR